MGGTMINFFNGQPTEEEQQAIRTQVIREVLSGSDNANKLVLNFNDSKEQGAEIIALNGTTLIRDSIRLTRPYKLKSSQGIESLTLNYSESKKMVYSPAEIRYATATNYSKTPT
jgi:hypothetical protein